MVKVKNLHKNVTSHGLFQILKQILLTVWFGEEWIGVWPNALFRRPSILRWWDQSEHFRSSAYFLLQVAIGNLVPDTGFVSG